jgi:hypothetical protein
VSRSPVIARIEERITLTPSGFFFLVILMLHQLASAIYFGAAKTAFQETSAAAIWIGENVLWGLGVALGRRSTYTVYRDPDA